jgi:hypothetical protein
MGVLYFNAPFKFKGQVMKSPVEKFESAVRFAEVAERLLAEGKIKPHPKDVRQNGLKGVLDGMQDLRAKKVRGRSLYTSYKTYNSSTAARSLTFFLYIFPSLEVGQGFFPG